MLDQNRFPPLSPEWWTYKLNAELDRRQPVIRRLRAYYDGDHPLPFIDTSKGRDAFLRLLRMSRSNWMELVVDATHERLGVVGFRFAGDEQADEAAWETWQENGLDTLHLDVMLDALIIGESAMTVDADGKVYVEDPAQVIVDTHPTSRLMRRAAFKKWCDDATGLTYGTLYLPEIVVKLQSDRKHVDYQVGMTIRWEPRETEGDDFIITNTLGKVPVVPFFNRWRSGRGGLSEISNVTDTQDRINQTLFERVMAGKYAAHRQRWVSGFSMDLDPQTGQPVKPFEASTDNLWVLENPEAKFGDFAATPLDPYIKGVETDVQHIAAQTRTPPHYLLGQSGQFPSGESLKATETGLVAKVNQRQVYFGESFEEIMRLHFAAVGDEERAGVVDTEVIWRNPESRTLGELTDALLKLSTLGVPRKALWMEWGASPQKVAQWEAMLLAERMETELFAPLSETLANQTADGVDASGA